jgi:hypothetical protein
MSDASVVFLPWVRQGLAARIAIPDPLKTPLPAQAPLGVTLGVNNVDAASVGVRLFGPADVIGIDPRQVVRTEPPAGTDNYEANDLAAVEFDNPDLPWLFTPASADGQGRVRPWIVLVVVRKQDGVRLRAPRTETLPVLEIATPAVPSQELPDLTDSWAWAHAQLGWEKGATEDDLRNVLATRPELSVSRLLSPRLLKANTEYIACVVPAFESGRLAGLGSAPDVNAALTPAWKVGPNAPGSVTLPVYYSWEFRTGEREDFESIVARLQPRDFSDTVGRRPMDISAPGFAVPQTTPPTVIPPIMLEGALQPVKAPRAPFPDDTTKVWQQKLQSIINVAGAGALDPNVEPVLGPPIYGRYYAGRNQIGSVQPPTWLDELNLDPRERVVAALGTRVIQAEQEELMAEAWDQAGEMAKVNQRMRQMQLSLEITSRLNARHVQRIDDDDTLWRFASPAQARMVMSAPANATPVTMRSMLVASTTPTVTTSAAMRRLARPSGVISRRAATAVRMAGMQAPAATSGTAITSMFRLYTAQPWVMIFTLPPTRGLVSFDAVTRRLQPAQQSMTFARGNDATVASMPPRPTFVVSGEPLTIVGTVTGGLTAPVAVKPAISRKKADARLRARPRPDPDDPFPDIPDPDPEPPPPPPPPPPPRVDSADAAAFRAAAVRHLGLVNPSQPWIILRPVSLVMLNAAAARPQVRALLDPVPAMMLRMQATIRLADGTAPPAIGAVGNAPVFTQPMSEPLAALSQDWLLPGLERVPVDSVAMLEPNQRFIETFMLGLNVEMGRELLWRDYVVNDPRATFFQRFWRTASANAQGDIAAIADWGTHKLTENKPAGAPAKQVVLLVRSVLFRRYPTAVVYAVPAVPVGNGREPGPVEQEILPLFRGSLQPDVTFFGFDLDADIAAGNPGWYFVVQQQPTEPRFGFDVEINFGQATHVPLTTPPAGHALPAGTTWAFNSAHMAQITRQQPVRVAIHASELIRTPPPDTKPTPGPAVRPTVVRPNPGVTIRPRTK